MSLTISTQYSGLTMAGRVAGASTAAVAATSNTKVALSSNLTLLKASLAGLKANINNISSIAVTDAGTLSFTAAELTGSTGVTKYADILNDDDLTTNLVGRTLSVSILA